MHKMADTNFIPLGMMLRLHRIAACFCFLFSLTAAPKAQVALSPTTLNFFTVYKGQPDSILVTLTNNKPSTSLVVTGIHFHHPEAFHVKEPSFSIAAGQSKSLWVYCDPRHNVRYLDYMVVETSTEAVVPNAFVFAQGKYSDTYYDGSQNKWDEDLESSLKSLIAFGYTDLGYNAARDKIFMQLDNKAWNGQGAAQNTIECVYTGAEAIGYTSRQDCQTNFNFNTEHTVPQSLFSTNPPMVSDMHHLWGTTSASNTERGNNPYGVVNNPNWTVGGSKSNGSTFEPRDAHKGKAARSMLYFALRYQDYSGFIAGQQSVLRTWSNTFLPDSVEIMRNEHVYTNQHNRNPFIDHPEFLERITTLVGTGTRPNVPFAYLGADTLTYSAPFPGSQTGYFVLSNQGLDTLHFSNISFSNPEFSLVGSPNMAIPQDSARKIYVKLTPNALGNSYNETVTLSTDDATHPSMTLHLVGQSIVVGVQAGISTDLLVYPQPAHGLLNLHWAAPLMENTALTLTDLQGRTLEKRLVESGTTDFGMNLEGKAAGCYFLQVQTNGSERMYKVILE